MRYREQRYPSDRELRVEHGGQTVRASLVNISATGARLARLGRLPSDAAVTLCHLNLRLPARVVWSNERQTGVRFVMPLGASEVNAFRGAAGGFAGPGAWDHGLRELG
ncbi:PilZ domain-containing protein [Limimaricola pyoseonensis]|uniref:PilZ domain-containing protein n=1 Tax=Limimaricola pyoseonensis TaxID=521013 RepID=A0A1G7FZH8_9RHOB|nr:PilZ domain-containing protein [Limimaricola pyoseonensis]SDE81230.1 PilZ domain-containing protein [Limimaricola pyoseonensis]